MLSVFFSVSLKWFRDEGRERRVLQPAPDFLTSTAFIPIHCPSTIDLHSFNSIVTFEYHLQTTAMVLATDFRILNSFVAREPYQQTTTMVLKRKRSDSEISTTSSILSSPLSSSNYMNIDGFQSQKQIATPSLFSSRTRKRHRDNRPSESDVHRMPSSFLPSAQPLTAPSTEHTLSLLFSAQQQHPQSQFQSPSPFLSQSHTHPIASIPASYEPPQQSSLHSFWAIPSARHGSPSSTSSNSSSNTPNTAPAINSFFQATNCEDCDASLNPQDNDDAIDVDMMMDIDMDGGNHACTSCGKQVCHSCAVSNLGAERKCLNCAGKKKACIGGIGWMNQD
jgi:hypothetical protein